MLENTRSAENTQLVGIDAQYNELTADSFPDYYGDGYIVINDNAPFFDKSELVTEPFEIYSELDSLGRCGAAFANICIDIMPTEKRGDISSVKPSGWHSVEYDFVPGKNLYNRSHLIGYQLAGENANEKNLITGTRYMNATLMLEFENMVADYVEETENHVLYRVTPYFEGDNLVAKGVLMEAESVEDDGDGILFNVFCYNVQDGVIIDYATGESWAE
ncbi:MAG: DNA/RNA non-specific endonuclease [Candidatus Ornithomonoglobus sp.]